MICLKVFALLRPEPRVSYGIHLSFVTVAMNSGTDVILSEVFTQ